MKVKVLLIMTVGALAIVYFVALIVPGSGGFPLYGASETTVPHDTETCACCDPNQGGNESAEHLHDEHSLNDVGHSHGEGKTSQVTVWDDQYEIFLEHPFIVVNQPVEFVTHVSDLVTLLPRKAGPVTFELQHDTGFTLSNTIMKPAREGIYISKLTFPRAGTWQLNLIIPVAGKEHRIVLPAFTVYRYQVEADLAPEPKESAGFSYLKEQQWKIPTRSEPVRLSKSAGLDVLVVPASAVIEEDGQAMVIVQVAGEAFAKRPVTLGKRENGHIEIQSGLTEGQYIVSQGVTEVAAAEFAEPDLHAHGEDAHAHDSQAPDTEAHSGHTHGEVDQSGPSGGEHEHEGIQLDEQQRKKFAIEVGRVTAGALDRYVRVPGEVKLNADRVAHIVPTAPGIVRQVLKNVGDPVRSGEIIAWLESAQLGQAKVTYLAHVFELSCCSIELTRAQEIHDNTIKLLDMLKSNPSLESLHDLNGSAMGTHRSDLIAAYAEYTFAQKTYDREKQLREKQITSEQDFLKAESSLKKADALYAAARDRIAYTVQRDLLEAQQAQQVRQMNVNSAERQLYVLGLAATDIQQLKQLANNQKPTPEAEHVCTDPNCKDCAKHKGKSPTPAIQDTSMMTEKLAWYPLRAPFGGTVLNKHITLGEMIPADATVFVIANLRTVWVDLKVHLNELSSIKKGQSVTISAGGRLPKAQGAISYLDPTINPKTRTALARVVLLNHSGSWRPGLFVSADITLEKTSTNPTVDKSSIQYLEDKPCVFVLHGGQFEPRFLTLGRSNHRYVEIVSGLETGETFVTKNSFRLKAEFMKRTMGDIGHGHAH